jgi:peptidoglycan/xylan/chitin deacetylase (PgdA/CDA1 family)
MKWIILLLIILVVAVNAEPAKIDADKKVPAVAKPVIVNPVVKKAVFKKAVVKKAVAKKTIVNKPIVAVKKTVVKKPLDNKFVVKKKSYNCVVPGLPMSTVKNLDPALFEVMLRHGDLAKKEIALTFDDGPKPGDTQKILAILKKYNAKATFFVVGEKAMNQQAVILQMQKEGHTVGNHTYHHPVLANMSMDQINNEIIDCGLTLDKIIGKSPRYFRPPGGDFDERVVMSAISAGYQIALWNVAPRDHECKSAKQLTDRIVSHTSSGSIVLLHVGMPFTIDALPGVLIKMQRKGFKFVSLDQMFPLVQPGKVKVDKKTATKIGKPKGNEVKR